MSLYELSIEGAEFSTLCGGNLGGEHETCLSLAAIPGAAEAFVVQDTKPEGSGQELRMTGEELDSFIIGAAKMRGLTL
jgi:hypothetical protein